MSEDPTPKKRGASAERMAELTRIRMEKAKTDPNAKGGRPRTKFKRSEVTEQALARLEPKAIKVLEEQLSSQDARVAQRAAQLLIEWKRGKAPQSIKTQNETATVVRYESAAWRPLKEIESEVVDQEPDELPPAA
jgi:hypothetical protein